MPTKHPMTETIIKSQPENVARLCEMFRSEAIKAGISEVVAMELELVISEAVTNIIEHAYEWDETQYIKFIISISNQSVTIEIKDQGKPIAADLFSDIEPGFDNPPDDVGLLAESGRGLKIIQSLIDDIKISHENGWNTLRLVKNL